jgi:hypothetical protein
VFHCGPSRVQAVQCLLQLLQQADWLFRSTLNKHHDRTDSDVNEVISKRFGRPLTVNLILQWILQKVNMASSLMDLTRHQRGHVLLGVTPCALFRCLCSHQHTIDGARVSVPCEGFGMAHATDRCIDAHAAQYSNLVACGGIKSA